MPNSDFILRCPKCNEEKEAEWVIGMRSYSARRLDVPYFMCGMCRTICVNKAAVRRAISLWRSELPSHKHLPSAEDLHKEMIETLERVVIDFYCCTAGYKRARFKRVTS